ncbi:hypothetical protein HMPREF9382_1223 [Streptococcus sanguinis SK115]|uniref:Uncharacterized protein n=1 Tax=Streptococcus sanguinis SK115 TaxID=888810 RepID=F0I984_STRSA|nr:hypothetical protein HMPREF9382_1223 [Streptococcus sanguinis SK115]
MISDIFDGFRQRSVMTGLLVSGNRMYRPVALLATGFFME